MAQKPEIQYIGQFYIHGSEAKALELKEQEQKKAKTALPQQRYERIRKVQVDVLAIGSILMAAVFLITMVAGALSLEDAWQEMDIARQYVYELQATNRKLEVQYHSQYNLDQIRSAAASMGLVPVSEAAVMKLQVTMPEPDTEPTWLENTVWFLKGLFDL